MDVYQDKWFFLWKAFYKINEVQNTTIYLELWAFCINAFFDKHNIINNAALFRKKRFMLTKGIKKNDLQLFFPKKICLVFQICSLPLCIKKWETNSFFFISYFSLHNKQPPGIYSLSLTTKTKLFFLYYSNSNNKYLIVLIYYIVPSPEY